MKRTAVIMAGGAGERFWPLSRASRPKQLIPLLSEKCMLAESVERIGSLISPEDVYIITGKQLLEPIRRAIPEIPLQNVIAEPFKRNTAPCLALASAFISAKYSGKFDESEISVAVLTADQNISPVSGFVQTVENILNYVETNGVIGTIGIKPETPSTGFGYLETESSGNPKILKVKCFREKPDLATAEKYLKSGIHFWNSGMFFFRLDIFNSEMKKALPEVGGKILSMKQAYSGNTGSPLAGGLDSIAAIFEAFPNISIDYGLMEKCGNIFTATASFKWDDIGSWDALDRIKPHDGEGNIIEGIAAAYDCKNTVIVNKTNGRIAVGAAGLDNFTIVVTDDAILVCPKDRAQDVKHCVEIFKKNENKRFTE